MDMHTTIPAGIGELVELERPLWPAMLSGIPEWHPRNETPGGVAPSTPPAQAEPIAPGQEPEWDPWEPEFEPDGYQQQPQPQAPVQPAAPEPGMGQNVQLAHDVAALQQRYGDAYEALEEKYDMSEGDAEVANTAAMHFANQLGDQRLAFHPMFIELSYLAAMGVNGGQQPSRTPKTLDQMSDQEIGVRFRDYRTGGLDDDTRATVKFWGAG